MFKDFLTKNLMNIQTAFKDKAFRKSFIAVVLFLIINVLKLSLYNYFLIPQATRDIFSYKFWFTLIYCIIVLTIVFSFRSRYLFLIFMVIQGIYCFTNISYYLYYHSYLHFLQWISLFKEALISATHLANPKSLQLVIVFIDAPLALYIFFKSFKKEFRKYSLSLLKYPVLAVSLVILIVVETVNFQQGKSLVQYMDDRYTGETEIVARYGTLVNSVVNILQNYSETKLIAQLSYGRKQTEENTIGKPSPSDGAVIEESRPNIVVIQVESMDANIVKQQHNGSYVMPFLSSMRENSIYYPYTLSYHQGGGTSDAEFSIINSIQPLDAFPAIKLSSYNYPNSFVSRLAKASYSTMAFHGNVGTFYNRNIALSKMGYNKFYDISSMNYEDEGWGAPDDKVFSFAFGKMQSTAAPFMVQVITMTSHGPFESARNYYNNENYDDIEDEIVRNYFNSFNYVDRSIEQFVTEVQSKFKNTYFIIYGDHTPNINNEDYHQASFIDGNRYFEFVPLFIITPDKQKHMESSKAASFLDIAPTVLSASNIPYTVLSDGTNLLSGEPLGKLPLKGGYFDRAWLYQKVSTSKYDQEEPLWYKYLPSFISSSLIERHK